MAINSVRQSIVAGELSATEVCRAALRRIEQHQDLNAFITVTGDEALARAARLDEAARKGDQLPPLAGAVLAVKDVLLTRGVRSTAGSHILHNYVPPYTATAVERLEAAGALVVGKTNCDEFAMGSSNENSAYGPAKNPWDTERVPGGSSGGSAVAVTAGLADAALGSDTGGSIRQPASLCGIVGLKPTYGRVSRYGLIAFASSLDQVGPLARTVEDCARVFQVIAGHDPLDATSSRREVGDCVGGIEDGVEGLRVGIPREYYEGGLDAEVREKVDAATRALADAGATLVDVSLPHTRYAIPVYYLVATAEASANLARFDGVRYGLRAEQAQNLKQMYARTRSQGFGAEVKRRIILGTYALSAGYYNQYYGKAQRVRTLIRRDFQEAFQHCDVIATPTTPTSAFRLGEKTDDPLAMYLSDIYTVTVNLAGVPALNVPCGLLSDGLPIGAQLIGQYFDEARMFRVARSIERALDFRCEPPALGRAGD